MDNSSVNTARLVNLPTVFVVRDRNKEDTLGEGRVLVWLLWHKESRIGLETPQKELTMESVQNEFMTRVAMRKLLGYEQLGNRGVNHCCYSVWILVKCI